MKNLNLFYAQSSYIGQIYKLVKSFSNQITDNEYYMGIAFLISLKSNCSRLKVGCIIVSLNKKNSNNIIATGYNKFISNTSSCISFIRDNHEQATIHAEQSAIINAMHKNITIINSKAYITHYPCIACIKILITAGVRSIYYCLDYNNDPFISKIAIFNKVDIIQLKEF